MDYQQLYALINELTPMNFDCGLMCEKACCRGDEDTPRGMILFPGEETLYHDKPGFEVRTAKLVGLEDVKMLTCNGHCDRALRPLSCRVFPLAPRFSPDGRLSVWMDSRGRDLCPLCHEPLEALTPAFVKAVRELFLRLADHHDCLNVMKAIASDAEHYDLQL